MGLLGLIVVFIRFIYLSVMAAIKIPNSSVIMQSVYGIIGIIAIAVYIWKSIIKSKLGRKELFMLSAMLTVFIMYCFATPNKYGAHNDTYTSMLYTGASSSIPAFLMGMLIRKYNKISDMGKWVPVFVLIMTISCFLVTINPSSTTGGDAYVGYMADASGLNYQGAAYTIAYAFGLNFYFITMNDKIKTFRMFSSRYMSKLFILMIPIQLLTLLISGGRGGFVVFVIFYFYYMILSSKNIMVLISKIIIVTVLAVAIISVMSVLDVETSGFGRIVKLIQTGEDGTMRSVIQERAIASWKRNLLLGSGFGSVFYEVGWYSHSIITDMLCEVGLAGMGLFIYMILKMINKFKVMVKEEKLTHLVFIVFLAGIIMSLFSNYYLALPYIWFTFGYIFFNEDECVRQQMGENTEQEVS